MPAILIAILFRYIFAIRTFAEVWLLTEGGPARLSEVLAIYLYRETFKYHEFGVGVGDRLVHADDVAGDRASLSAQDVSRGRARCVGPAAARRACASR